MIGNNKPGDPSSRTGNNPDPEIQQADNRPFNPFGRLVEKDDDKGRSSHLPETQENGIWANIKAFIRGLREYIGKQFADFKDAIANGLGLNRRSIEVEHVQVKEKKQGENNTNTTDRSTIEVDCDEKEAVSVLQKSTDASSGSMLLNKPTIRPHLLAALNKPSSDNDKPESLLIQDARKVINRNYSDASEGFKTALLEAFKNEPMVNNELERDVVANWVPQICQKHAERLNKTSASAKQAIDDFYSKVHNEATEQVKQGRNANDASVYADSKNIEAFKQRSQQYIEHTLSLYKPGMTQDDFYKLIAAQHYVDFDCQQLDKIEAQRQGVMKYEKFDDQGVATQLHKDLGRADYSIKGQTFGNNDDNKASEAYVQFIKDACSEIGITDAEKIKKITEKISVGFNQSALGNVVRGFRFLDDNTSLFVPNIEGMDQKSSHALISPSKGIIKLEHSNLQTGFTQVSRMTKNDKANCDPSSSLSKGASVLFVIDPDTGDVTPVVEDAYDKADIVNPKPLSKIDQEAHIPDEAIRKTAIFKAKQGLSEEGEYNLTDDQVYERLNIGCFRALLDNKSGKEVFYPQSMHDAILGKIKADGNLSLKKDLIDLNDMRSILAAKHEDVASEFTQSNTESLNQLLPQVLKGQPRTFSDEVQRSILEDPRMQEEEISEVDMRALIKDKNDGCQRDILEANKKLFKKNIRETYANKSKSFKSKMFDEIVRDPTMRMDRKTEAEAGNILSEKQPIVSALESAEIAIAKNFPLEKEGFNKELLEQLRKEILSNPKQQIQQSHIQSKGKALQSLRDQNLKLAQTVRSAFFTKRPGLSNKKTQASDSTPVPDFLTYPYRKELTENQLILGTGIEVTVQAESNNIDAPDSQTGKNSQDTFRENGVCDQAYKDFDRSTYIIGDNKLTKNKDEAEKEFAGFITQACQNAGVTDAKQIKSIMQKISLEASQSGIANCTKGIKAFDSKVDCSYDYKPQRAAEDVIYHLKNEGKGIISLDMASVKSQFSKVSQPDGNVVNCDPSKSSLKGGASLYFSIQKDGKLDVWVDRVYNEINIDRL